MDYDKIKSKDVLRSLRPAPIAMNRKEGGILNYICTTFVKLKKLLDFFFKFLLDFEDTHGHY
jgi:hypothetical protein